MFENDQFNQNNQFVISYELLSLLLWIIEHEEETLAHLVRKAFASGLDISSQKSINENMHLLKEAQQAMIDFFNIMESHMIESMHERSIQKAFEKNLLPAIDQIDMSSCDDETVRLSVERATNASENGNSETARDTLYKELLSNWKPQKNQVLN